MSELRILVVGAGIAGSTAAYWLGKAGIHVTVIERAPALRTAGQGIDVEGPSLEVVKRMGLEEEARKGGSGEIGLKYVNEKDQTVATFDTANKDNDIGFTSEIEIMRGTLAELLFQAANALENVEFRYSCTIESLSQTPGKVHVTFGDGRLEEFDILIAADGLGSRTRDLILTPEDRKACFFSLGAYVAYFSIPREEQDGPRGRFHNSTKRRSVLIRPRDEDVSSAFIGIIQESPELANAVNQDTSAQKALLAKLFEDMEWKEAKRVVKQMQDADDFYYQAVAQVRLDEWSRGRCVLLGDAAYCPSPFSGKGTPLAMQGAYILAGEIVSHQDDPATAFRLYQEKMIADVKAGQGISLDGLLPKILNPETSWGVWILRTILWSVANSGVLRLGALIRWLIFRSENAKANLPEYDFGIREI